MSWDRFATVEGFYLYAVLHHTGAFEIYERLRTGQSNIRDRR